jgi:hypothetical protein
MPVTLCGAEGILISAPIDCKGAQGLKLPRLAEAPHLLEVSKVDTTFYPIHAD